MCICKTCLSMFIKKIHFEQVIKKNSCYCSSSSFQRHCRGKECEKHLFYPKYSLPEKEKNSNCYTSRSFISVNALYIFLLTSALFSSHFIIFYMHLNIIVVLKCTQPVLGEPHESFLTCCTQNPDFFIVHRKRRKKKIFYLTLTTYWNNLSVTQVYSIKQSICSLEQKESCRSTLSVFEQKWNIWGLSVRV